MTTKCLQWKRSVTVDGCAMGFNIWYWSSSSTASRRCGPTDWCCYFSITSSTGCKLCKYSTLFEIKFSVQSQNVIPFYESTTTNPFILAGKIIYSVALDIFFYPSNEFLQMNCSNLLRIKSSNSSSYCWWKLFFRLLFYSQLFVRAISETLQMNSKFVEDLYDSTKDCNIEYICVAITNNFF